MPSPDRAPWTAARVRFEVDRTWGAPCADCGLSTVGQEVVIGLLLGEADPRCGACLARRHGRDPDEFLAHARRSVSRLDCFRAGWEAADRRTLEEQPSRWPARLRIAQEREDEVELDAFGEGAPGQVAATYDAGDLGCGELVLELRSRLNALRAGERLRLIARDPGAPEDLPAWCGLTGHRLVDAAHPTYLIARRPDPATTDS